MIDTSSPDIPKIKKAALILCEAIAVPSRRREGSEGRGNHPRVRWRTSSGSDKARWCQKEG